MTSTANHGQACCTVGQLCQVRSDADLDKVIVSEFPRPLLVGDVLICVQHNERAGYCQYYLVDILDEERIRIVPGACLAADPLGVPLACHFKGGPEEQQAFMRGDTVAECSGFYTQVAEFNKALSPARRQARLAAVEEGCVLTGSHPDGTPLFPGNCAMVLRISDGKTRKYTLGFLENGRLTKRKVTLAEIPGAILLDDPGMEANQPVTKGLHVLGYYAPGTILTLPVVPFYNYIGSTQVQRWVGKYALVRKVVDKRGLSLVHAFVRVRSLEACEVKFALGVFRDQVKLN